MHVSLIWISAGAIFETSLIVRDDSMKSFLSFIVDCKRWFSEIIKKHLFCSLEISELLRVPASGPWAVLGGTEKAGSTRSPFPIRDVLGRSLLPSPFILHLGSKGSCISHNSSPCQYFSSALSYIMDRSLKCNLNQFWTIRGKWQGFRLWEKCFSRVSWVVNKIISHKYERRRHPYLN